MTMFSRIMSLVGLFVGVAGVTGVDAADQAQAPEQRLREEFQIKRQDVFEFTKPPQVSRSGDRVTIAFAVKEYCDVTVAIEDTTGRILRHLASGVLGPNAPEPLQKDSLEQVLVWDSKDDQGRYVDETGNVVVRVSLGLRARFERHFLWSPHRRISTQGGTFNTHGAVPDFFAQPEGVYVFDGRMFDHVRLFDHEGNYVRTVYPFPADKLDELVGVKTHTFPQSGETLPLRGGTYGTTLLTSGTNYRGGHGQGELYGVAARPWPCARGDSPWSATR